MSSLILNSPYEEPAWHWEHRPGTVSLTKVKGRRTNWLCLPPSAFPRDGKRTGRDCLRDVCVLAIRSVCVFPGHDCHIHKGLGVAPGAFVHMDVRLRARAAYRAESGGAMKAFTVVRSAAPSGAGTRNVTMPLSRRVSSADSA